MNYVPRVYQKRGIRALLEHPHHGLFLEPGLGKTSTVLAAYQILKKRGFVSGVLVVAPLRVCLETWPREAAKWDQFQGLKLHVLHGKDKEKLLHEPADVYLVNPEGLAWLAPLLLKMKRWPFEWLVVDESTKFKRTNTQRFKLLKPLLPRFARRNALTGTPSPNGLMDLFGQMYVIDCGRSLGPYITRFRAEFFYPTGYGGYEWAALPDAEERILQRIKPVTTTMLAEDWLDLPELVPNVVPVTLPPAARRAYRELEDDFITQLRRGEIVASNAAAKSAKLRQVTGGGVYDEEGNVHEIHEAKVDALESLVEEADGSPILVAYEFDHERARLLRRFPKAGTVYGGQPAKAFKRTLDAWNAGDLALLVGQSSTIYHGLNLQEGPGHRIAWFGMTWDYEVYYQVIKRLHRQGQAAGRVIAHHLLAEDTVDQLMYEVVAGEKRSDQRRVLEALKTRLGRRS